MTNLESRGRFIIPEDHIVPKLRKLVASGCDLLAYADRVHNERLARKNSKQWVYANKQIFYGLMFDFYHLFKENRDFNHQVNAVLWNMKRWKLTIDVKTWRTFCGRTHAVPTEKIAAFAAELQTLEDVLIVNIKTYVGL